MTKYRFLRNIDQWNMIALQIAIPVIIAWIPFIICILVDYIDNSLIIGLLDGDFLLICGMMALGVFIDINKDSPFNDRDLVEKDNPEMNSIGHRLYRLKTIMLTLGCISIFVYGGCKAISVIYVSDKTELLVRFSIICTIAGMAGIFFILGAIFKSGNYIIKLWEINGENF